MMTKNLERDRDSERDRDASNLSGTRLSRRALLSKGGGSLVAISILSNGILVGGNEAWAASAEALSADHFATLVQMSRDIYPHDRIADTHYVTAAKVFDMAASQSSEDKALFENGLTALDESAMAAHGFSYRGVGWEIDRVNLLRAIENTPFFQRIRGGLVTGLYNNPAVWEILGYEGPSASQGGYLNRGFDDIDWL